MIKTTEEGRPLNIDARVLDWDGSDRLGRASFDPYMYT
jgi:hypothetical protein